MSEKKQPLPASLRDSLMPENAYPDYSKISNIELDGILMIYWICAESKIPQPNQFQ